MNYIFLLSGQNKYVMLNLLRETDFITRLTDIKSVM